MGARQQAQAQCAQPVPAEQPRKDDHEDQRAGEREDHRCEVTWIRTHRLLLPPMRGERSLPMNSDVGGHRRRTARKASPPFPRGSQRRPGLADRALKRPVLVDRGVDMTTYFFATRRAAVSENQLVGPSVGVLLWLTAEGRAATLRCELSDRFAEGLGRRLTSRGLHLRGGAL